MAISLKSLNSICLSDNKKQQNLANIERQDVFLVVLVQTGNVQDVHSSTPTRGTTVNTRN
jgi:hypothetical protein